MGPQMLLEVDEQRHRIFSSTTADPWNISDKDDAQQSVEAHQHLSQNVEDELHPVVHAHQHVKTVPGTDGLKWNNRKSNLMIFGNYIHIYECI